MSKLVPVSLVCLTAWLSCAPNRGAQQGDPDPSVAMRERDFQHKRQCAEEGRRYYAEIVRAVAGKSLVSDPEYCFSAPLNTCLYFGGTLDVKDKTQNKWVYDVLTNKELAQHAGFWDRPGVPGQPTLGDFNNQLIALAAGCLK